MVDDDPGMLRCVQRLLRQHAYEPIVFSSAQAFKSHTDFEEAVCIILDINLNDGSGIELRHHLNDEGVSVPVIFMTGNANPAVRGPRWTLDASQFLQSPFPRNRSLSRSRKHRQGVHRLRRSSLVDGLVKLCTCMSAIGTKRTCWAGLRMSVYRGRAEVGGTQSNRRE